MNCLRAKRCQSNKGSIHDLPFVTSWSRTNDTDQPTQQADMLGAKDHHLFRPRQSPAEPSTLLRHKGSQPCHTTEHMHPLNNHEPGPRYQLPNLLKKTWSRLVLKSIKNNPPSSAFRAPKTQSKVRKTFSLFFYWLFMIPWSEGIYSSSSSPSSLTTL